MKADELWDLFAAAALTGAIADAQREPAQAAERAALAADELLRQRESRRKREPRDK